MIKKEIEMSLDGDTSLFDICGSILYVLRHLIVL